MEHSVEARITILILTSNRRAQLLNKLELLCQLPERWPIIVVDNGSSDGTADIVASRFPQVLLVCAKRNLGAAARNIGVAYVHTPYVAFCDDNTLWESDALNRALHLLDTAADVAVLSAHVEPGARQEAGPGLFRKEYGLQEARHFYGPQSLGFMAGACIMRTRAFYDVGGYWPPLFLGGEEALMALDLAEQGWRIAYADDVVARHLPNRDQASDRGRYRLIRNAIWVAWMRLPLRAAWRETCFQVVLARRHDMFGWTMLQVLWGLPRALRRRKVISLPIEALKVLLERPAATPAAGSES